MANEAAAPANTAPAQTTENQTNHQQQQQQVTSDQKPSTATQQKVWKHPVDGKEVVWTDEKELLKDAGLGKAAFQRMREAAELKRNVETFIEKIKKDPMGALEDPALGLSDEQRREVIEHYYQKKYLSTDNLSPEQKRIRELEAQVEQNKKSEDDRAEQAKTEAAQKSQTKWRDTYQQQIIENLEKGGLPKTPKSAARMAFYMAQAIESGFEAPVETIIDQVRNDYVQEIQDVCHDSVPIEAILKVLPPGLVKRIRKYDLEQYKARQSKQSTPNTPEVPERTTPKREERKSYAEVLRKFGS